MERARHAWARHTTIAALLAALAVAGCKGGGVTLTGEQAVTAPAMPSDTKAWLSGPVELAALRGQVVLIEAWHPS